MEVICTRCGSTKIICRAWINPNEAETGKALGHYRENSFKSGFCLACKKNSRLTDSKEISKKIDVQYRAYKEQSGKEPFATRCEITYCSPRNGTEEVLIKISPDKNGSKSYFPYCEDINTLKDFCGKTAECFIVTDIYNFE